MMKNKFFFVGALALVLVLGLALAGCKTEEETITLQAGTYEGIVQQGGVSVGTITITLHSNGTATLSMPGAPTPSDGRWSQSGTTLTLSDGDKSQNGTINSTTSFTLDGVKFTKK